MYHVRSDAPSRLFSKGGEKGFGNMKINIMKREKDLLVFEMLNTDASIANALRRIMIAEVETVAIKDIGMSINTSIIVDEVLVHRIGLVPFNVDPERLNPGETLDFDLHALCQQGKEANVYSSSLAWIPSGDQEARFADCPPRPIHDDILLAKLLPGQEIFLRAQLVAGEGRDHAKWSPVATASYRTMPHIKVSSPTKIAADLVQSCPKNVFDIEDSETVVVARPLQCTMCRECLRPEGWDQVVTLARIADHFIFSIESVGMLTPEEIFKRAIKILARKANDLAQEME